MIFPRRSLAPPRSGDGHGGGGLVACLLLALTVTLTGSAGAQSTAEPLVDPVPANLYTQLPDDELAWWPDGGQVEAYLVAVNDPHLYATDDYDHEYLTVDVAEEVCGATGGTVATPDQLDKAYDKGADWCSCGILSDGSYAYPIQTARTGCADHPGVQACGPGFDRNFATCYGVRPSKDMVTAWDDDNSLQKFAQGEWSRYCDTEGDPGCPPAVQSVDENPTVTQATVERLSFAAPVPQPHDRNPMPSTALAKGRFVTNDADQLVTMTKTGRYEQTTDCNSFDYELAGYVDQDALDPNGPPVTFPEWSGRPCLAPRTDWWSSPFDLAAGDLDRAMDADGDLHDELVIAVEEGDPGTNPPGYPVIHVLDYAADPTDPTETVYELPHDDAHAINRLRYNEKANGAEPRGILVAETFDAYGDGARLIATLHSTYDGSSGNYAFQGNVLEYTPPTGSADSGEITPVGSFTLDYPSYSTPTSYRSTADLAAGDFDGDGKEELAVFYLDDNASHLVVLAATPDQGVQRLSEWTTDSLSARSIEQMELVSGLFYFDPDSGFDMGRRQLALGVYDAQAQKVRMKVFRLDGACGVAQATDIDQTPATTTAALGFAAGNFAGSQAQPTDPIWSLAVGYAYGADQDGYHIQLIDPSTNRQTDVVRQAWNTKIPPALLAFDRDGDSLYLGAPVTFRMDQPQQLLSSLEQPPQHLDYLPNQAGANSAGLLNVSRDPDFRLTFSKSASSTLSSNQSSAFSWTAGGSAHASASITLSEQIPVIEKASLKGSASAGIGYVHSSSSTSSAGDASRVTIEMSESPVADDALYLIMKPYEIWRYRLYGAETTDPSTPYAYYEVFKPIGDETSGWFAGLTVDAYQPLHENGNILSYPDIHENDPASPPDLGSWSPTALPPDCDQPPPPSVSYQRPLTGDTVHTLQFSGVQSTLEVQLDTQDTCGGSRSSQDDLKESLDVRLSVNAKESEIFATEKEKGSVNVHLSGNESWADLAAWNTTTQESENLAITTVAAADPDFGYSFAPSFYFADDGNLKVAFYASPPGQTQNWWASTYKLPDPAFNLPRKFTAPNGDDWQLDTSMKARRIRGFALRDGSEIDPDTGLGPLLASIPKHGDTVQVEVMVYNYSLAQQFQGLEVRFDIADYDPVTKTVTDRRILESVPAKFTDERDPSGIGSDSGTFPPRGVGRALYELETSKLPDAEGIQDYVIYAVLNPSSTKPSSETHPWRSANVFTTLYTNGQTNVGSTMTLAFTDQTGNALGTVQATSSGNVPEDIETLAKTFNDSDLASTYGLQATAYPPQTPQNQPVKLVLTAGGNGTLPDPGEFQPTLALKNAVNGVQAIRVAPSVSGSGNATIEASNLTPGQNNEGYGLFALVGSGTNASAVTPALRTSLAAADLSGRVVESAAQAAVGRPLRVRLCAFTDTPTAAIVDLPIFLGDPADGKGVAVKRLYGIDADGSCAWLDWTPPAAGSYTLEAVVPRAPSAADAAGAASGGNTLTVQAQ